MNPTIHIPILSETIVKTLTEPIHTMENPWIIDCTLGGGGHTEAFLLKGFRVLGLDRDPDAISRAGQRFKAETDSGKLVLKHGRFSELGQWVSENRASVVALLADLGFSSDQLEDTQRGLSFQKDGPLDMRLDSSQGESCYEYLDRVSSSELEKILFEFGEERFSRRISRAITEKRAAGNLPKTTTELSRLIIRAIPTFARHGKIHASTRSFQALRMVVNDELKELDCLLKDVIPLMQLGGRVAILSFHSIEDRLVKSAFRGPKFLRLTKKPIVPEESEILRNPRSRSAKLRLAQLK